MDSDARTLRAKKKATTEARRAGDAKKTVAVSKTAPGALASPAVKATRPAASRHRSPASAVGPAWQPSRRADFLVGILGNKLIANLLRVAESQPSRWRRAEEVPGPQVAPVLVDLDHIVGRLLLIWDRSVIGDWLTGANSFLDGARPIDVLVARGSVDVIEAIEAETAGTYA
jgi:hypothetical protein